MCVREVNGKFLHTTEAFTYYTEYFSAIPPRP